MRQMALLFLLLAGAGASAQVTIKPSFSSTGPVSITVTPEKRIIQAITGLPWSGVQTSERILPNGTHMDQSSTHNFRDSRGRTRAEHSGTGYGSAVIVEIDDPVDGHTWILDPVNQIAHRLTLQSKSRVGATAARSCPVGGETTTNTTANGTTSVTETLGAKTIQGITACGSRDTISRKDQAVPMVAETWFASGDVGGLVLNKTSEPQGTASVFELGDVKFNEPDAGLFEPPAGYRIVDEATAFTMVIGEAPAKPAPAFPAGVPVTALTGMPWSGELLSGTTVLTRQYRDSMGRTRREPVALVNAKIDIVDPIAGFRYSIDTAARTVHRTPIASAKSIPASSAAVAVITPQTTKLAGGVTGLTEPLGAKKVDGIDTYGSRTTLTYPPGTLGGNDKTFVTVNEAWFSPQLGVALAMRSSGPLTGDSTTTFTNLKYSEPDPALFRIPDGYQVIDGKF